MFTPWEVDLQDVQERVSDKYTVTASDAELSIKYLRCFFHAKKSHPEELIILPQIADWAWHELILDSKKYDLICLQIFGGFLHHVNQHISPSRAETDRLAFDGRPGRPDSTALQLAFSKSLDLWRETYQLGLGDRPADWLEAGWDRPLYRLRKPIAVPDGQPERLDESSYPPQVESLSWLVPRLARRFGLTKHMASAAVAEYASALQSLGSGCPPQRLLLSTICEVAWEEHVLWTEVYARDCDHWIGRFIEHTPRQLGGHRLLPAVARAA